MAVVRQRSPVVTRRPWAKDRPRVLVTGCSGTVQALPRNAAVVVLGESGGSGPPYVPWRTAETPDPPPPVQCLSLIPNKAQGCVSPRGHGFNTGTVVHICTGLGVDGLLQEQEMCVRVLRFGRPLRRSFERGLWIGACLGLPRSRARPVCSCCSTCESEPGTASRADHRHTLS